jgi:tRNA U38,U39,U40 pseudouridine synthase TruA
MPSSSVDPLAIVRIGFEALRNEDARTAREAFERVIAAGRADAAVHAALGYACVRLNDKPPLSRQRRARCRSIRETCAR